MTFKNSLLLLLIALLWVVPQSTAQNTAPQAATPTAPQNGPAASPGARPAPGGPDVSMDTILDRATTKENELIALLKNYTPMVETYIQNLTPNAELGAVPTNDRYFLGKLDLKDGISEHSLLPEPGFASALKNLVTNVYSIQYLPLGFTQMILIDGLKFDRANYDFEYIRREFLGEIRTYAFDVKPKPEAKGFMGRIWIEDQGYNIVRFNGTYNGSSASKMFFHFDSWREQIGDGKWLPTYVYSEESDMPYFLGSRKLRFKGQTRLWGYDVGKANLQNEFTSLVVEADKVEDNGDAVEHNSPVLSQRAWLRQAEDNVLARMQKAGVLAPEGEVDKVLQTVVNNLEITNNLTTDPPIRCRVLLTQPLESFSVGHTIVLSRGLVDVLPDEASLAMVLAHELGHIYLYHQIDTKYSFNDRMIFPDVDTFRRLHMKRDAKEEKAADDRAMELLQNSPYRDKLGNAGLFLKALNERSGQLPNLLKAHMGNRLAEGKNVRRMPSLMESAPPLENAKLEQIAALPLGGRLKLDPWHNQLDLIKTKPVALLSPREKMMFEVTPVYLYLTRQKAGATAANNKNN
jgi:hypothetical protein